MTNAVPDFTVDDLTSQALYLEEAWHSPTGRAIREIIFGSNDGLVTTLGFLMGVYGAMQDQRIILITGIAEAAAGAISMATGAYLSSKAEREYYEREMRREIVEMREKPAQEQEEVRRIYRAKGFEGAELEAVVRRITADPRVWLQCMMLEELGLIAEPSGAPVRAAMCMGLSFIAGAAVPLVPYMVLTGRMALLTSVACSMATLFTLGAAKTALTKRRWWSGGVEMLALGMFACAVGYLVGCFVGALH